MSERMTGVKGPETPGIADWGRKTRAEMLEQHRVFYERQKAEAEKALAVPEDELVVETYLGPYAMKSREIVT